jgi:hypothetical protein
MVAIFAGLAIMTLVATEASAFETLTDGRVVIEAKGRKLAFYPEDGEYIQFAARCPSETKGQLLTKQSSPTLAEVLSNPAVAKCVIEEAQTPFRNFLTVGTFPKDSVLRIVASRKPADFPGGADTLRILVGTGNKPSFKRLPDSPPDYMEGEYAVYPNRRSLPVPNHDPPYQHTEYVLPADQRDPPSQSYLRIECSWSGAKSRYCRDVIQSTCGESAWLSWFEDKFDRQHWVKLDQILREIAAKTFVSDCPGGLQ